MKGRGARRRPNALLIRVDGQVARVALDFSEGHLIDRHGLLVTCDAVVSSSGRGIRSRLLNCEKKALHLCRGPNCSHPTNAWHLPEYAVVDSDAIIDVSKLTSCKLFMGAVNFVIHSLFYVSKPFTWALGRLLGCCTCRGRRRLRVDHNGIHELSSDSESESEAAEHPCQAVKIGVMGDRGMRPLAPFGCGDEAQMSPTTLLVEDADVSDVGPHVDGENF